MSRRCLPVIPYTPIHWCKTNTCHVRNSPLFKVTCYDPSNYPPVLTQNTTRQNRIVWGKQQNTFSSWVLEMVLDHRPSVLHTNLDVLKQNVQNVDKVWLLLQSVKTLVHDSLYNRFCAVTRLSYEQTDDIKSSRFKIFCDRLTRPDRARHTVCWYRTQRNRTPCRANGAATQQAPHPARVRELAFICPDFFQLAA